MENRTGREVLKLVICLVTCQLAGAIGSFFTAPAISSWYIALSKPSFTPPNWLFAPAWIALYTLMAVSAFLVWRVGLHDARVRKALSIFGLQLLFNALWSPAFFGLRSPLAGAIVIVVLWITILWTLVRFRTISLPAALLLVPYILWVSFATALNISIATMNM